MSFNALPKMASCLFIVSADNRHNCIWGEGQISKTTLWIQTLSRSLDELDTSSRHTSSKWSYAIMAVGAWCVPFETELLES